ncbi:DUF393 domain-containing protein [Endozoicomonas sp. Mp262]|uniref:thiol-disulfide oxidoreductase DCC family protein n=1 Tax=Endozoicomonas sp. Mp262 TaxID=2919499 RepID=UPI0021DB41DB
MTISRKDISFPVTLFYDGSCPLCMKEVHWLQSKNNRKRLRFVDIKQADFAQHYPHLDVDALDNTLHAQWSNGKIVKGVDATVSAWEAVGKGWLLTPLTWPLFSDVATCTYKTFARNRHWLSSKLGPYMGDIPCQPQAPDKN